MEKTINFGYCAELAPMPISRPNDMKAISYEDYGAKGDGVTDDSAAIRAAHTAANEQELPVVARSDAKYYIGELNTPIVIETETNWNGAEIIFGDESIAWTNPNRLIDVFAIRSKKPAVSLDIPEGYSLKKGQKSVGMTFDEPCMLKIENANEKIYKRYGANANNGVNKNEMILVDENGNVDPTTPIQYDYSEVTKITRISTTDEPIFVGNARVTTIVYDPKKHDPDYDNNYCYYARGIITERSNTTLYGIKHRIVGEDMTIEIDRNGDGIIDKWGADKSYGVPYAGTFSFGRCNNALMTDCYVQGHQAYSFWQVSGNSKARNEMGSYDIYATDCVNLSLVNITQYENKETGEVITNRFMYHGIMGTNFCRNMVVDNCYIDRFDAHQGLHNARITNSTIGFGILVIGGGELYIENVYRIGNDAGNDAFILLRHDYNSVFDGDLIIKNCKMGKNVSYLISGVWREFYNGLPNHMFNSITIDGLVVEGRNTLSIYGVSGAFEDVVDNKVNKLYLPTSITVSGVVGTTGRPVTVKASQTEDAFATVPVTKK